MWRDVTTHHIILAKMSVITISQITTTDMVLLGEQQTWYHKVNNRYGIVG